MLTDAHAISTEALREELPRIRKGLAAGRCYTVIYRSKPIAHLEPIAPAPQAGVRMRGGTLRLQAVAARPLTPEYLNGLAAEKYI